MIRLAPLARHQSLSVFLCLFRETPHCDPDDLASSENGSDLLQSNGQTWLRPLCFVSKYRFPRSPLWKIKGIAACFRCMDAVLSTFFFSNPPDIAELKFFYINLWMEFKHHYGASHGVHLNSLYNFPKLFPRLNPYTGAYTNHHLSILLHWWFW